MKKDKRKHPYMVVGALLITMITITLLYTNFPENKDISYKIYTVRAGDTLWSVSSHFPHKDIRRLIYDIEQANGCTAEIREGQELRIPIIN